MVKYQIYIFFCISLVITSISQAASRFSGGAMVLFGTGSMGNSVDVLSRSMVHTPIGLFGGINIKSFRIGFHYEFNMVGQTADPTTVNNQNIGGKASASGLRLDYYDGKQAVGVIMKMAETYTLDKPTITGDTAIYEGSSSMGIQYYRSFKKKIGFVFDYSMGQLKSSAGLSNDITYDRISLGIVFSNFEK